MVLETSSPQIGTKLSMTDIIHVQANGVIAPNSLDTCLENVVNWVVSRYGKDYFKEPLEDFMRSFGKVFPEDEFYQERMNLFLEHCILQRPLTGQGLGRSPMVEFMDDRSITTDRSSIWWKTLCEFRHTIFEVTKSGSDQIAIKDLITDQTLIVRPKESETLRFVEKRSIMQGFVFRTENGHYCFGQGIIHPPRARKLIQRAAKEHRKKRPCADATFLTKLALINLKYLRMHHVDPEVIYLAIQ